ncbi:inorganic phosphate transporter [Nocardioides lianchengensis]|uniref:Phosphate transporter n=1 Tax=Nocardioides lianchengensis TaxID=1045774 RepID=A0A1G6UUF1_9ACTN|nr:inorganic phosphate transporter [Nocardioides lianchengensis]NYG11022.1 PiT family inorganic phosphate transporter [Nocardioides lianchengensis]SDD44185.1 inorganic phosphate transporter, PiT family [Nocardioides lianchengensis]
MDQTLLAVIGVVALALLFDFTNGFHDSANQASTIVATRVLRPRLAVAWAAFFNFIAFLFFGTAVANAVGEVVDSAAVGVPVVFSALVGAIVWNYLTWWLGLPSSSSHALVGGLVGAGVAAAGADAIAWGEVRTIAIFIVVSPVAGAVVAYGVGRLARLLERGTSLEDDSRTWKGLQLVSSASMALGHGANDAQKTMGVIAALLVATGHLAGGSGEIEIPLWVVLAAHGAIAAGTLSGGWSIIRTMGMRITELRPASGFAAETGAAAAVFTSTLLGVPVSTTHTTAGAVTGVGLAWPRQAVHWGIAGRMLVAWAVTVPAAALVAATAYFLTRLPAAGEVLAIGALLVGLAVVLVVALRRSVGVADIDRELAGAPA